MNWIMSNRTVWSFNYVYLQNEFTNHIFDLRVKTEFAINLSTMNDISENQTKSN